MCGPRIGQLAYRLLLDEHAATATEYAVLLALIVVVVMGAVSTLSASLLETCNEIGDKIGEALG